MQAPNTDPSGDMPVFTDDDAAKLWSIPPPPQQPEHLPLPVCLPQVANGYSAPFARAYSPAFPAAHVTLDDWLGFCDGLNIAMTASPPLRVVDMAGKVLGFVPYHWSMIAGILMQVGAQTAQHALSKTLTDRYLRHANERFFAPRGLRVRLCRNRAMRQLVGIDATPEKQPGKMAVFGHVVGRNVENVALSLPVPFVGRVIEGFSKPVPKVDADSPLDVTGRRLADLNGYISPLDFNVPPAKKPEGLMDQMSELSVKLDRFMANRKEGKVTNKRHLLAIREGNAQPGQDPTMSFRQQRKEYKAARKGRRDARKGRMPGGVARIKVAKADRLEFNHTDALVWIVVLNAEQDRDIEGTALVDNKEDQEIVDESEWEEELELEDEEDEGRAPGYT